MGTSTACGMWPLNGPRDSRELRRARELRPFYDTVDHLFDHHSMLEQQPPIALVGDTDKGWRWQGPLARRSTSWSIPACRLASGCATTLDFGDPAASAQPCWWSAGKLGGRSGRRRCASSRCVSAPPRFWMR